MAHRSGIRGDFDLLMMADGHDVPMPETAELALLADQRTTTFAMRERFRYCISGYDARRRAGVMQLRGVNGRLCACCRRQNHVGLRSSSEAFAMTGMGAKRSSGHRWLDVRNGS